MKRYAAITTLCISLVMLQSCKEDGTFTLNSGPTTIGLLPFGNIDQDEVDSVQTSIQNMYDFEVVILPRKELPKNAYTEIRYPRYRADTLVAWLAFNKPDSVDKIIGLTKKDISITKYKEGSNKIEIKDPEWQYKDFGIFGLGQRGGNACVVSSNRLYHGGVSKEKFFIRLTRIACHEIGHTLGLSHCPNPKCLMNDANESIKTIDRSTGVLCDECKSKI